MPKAKQKAAPKKPMPKVPPQAMGPAMAGAMGPAQAGFKKGGKVAASKMACGGKVKK